MKLTTQKTIQNPNSQMMSLFDENDICVGEIHKRKHAEHIVKCVNSHDALVDTLKELERTIPFNGYHYAIINKALKAAGETA